MQVEVSVALNFIISYLYNKLPRRRVDLFGEELEKAMKKKFEGHWYPEKPFKGSGFRCVRIIEDKVDPVLETAAHLTGLDIEEIKEYLPKDFSVWVDPGEVSYRIGEKGVARVVYSNKSHDGLEGFDKEIQAASRGFNPEAQCFKPIDSLSSSMSNLSVSPSSPGSPPSGGPLTSTSPITSFLNRNNNTPMFTTASFAQTKFGSTKLKSSAKRPTRLSPTEAAPGFLKPGRSMPGLNQQQQSPLGNQGFLQHSPTGNQGFLQQSPTGSQGFVQHSPTGNPGFIQHSPTGNGPVQPGFMPQQNRSRTLSPRDLMHRDLRQEYLEQQHRLLFAQQQQQQQQQQQHHQQQQQQQSQFSQSPSLLSPSNGSPLGGSLTDLYGTYQSNALNNGYLDLMRPNQGLAKQGTPSPDGNKSLLDAVNVNTLPPYANLQHLLVAN